jgi:hypothetical protein
MRGLGYKLKTISSPGTSREHLKFPRPPVVWLGLIGFILGVTLCPFSPPNGGRDDLLSVKESKMMTTLVLNKTSSSVVQPVEVTQTAGFQTATFALG